MYYFYRRVAVRRELVIDEKNGKPTLADIVEEDREDERKASATQTPKYEQLEADIAEAFDNLLDNTKVGITDLHTRRLYYSKVINAMPLLIVLENDFELTGHDGQNMYQGIQELFDYKYASPSSFSGQEILEAKQTWNELYFDLTGKAGATELGDLWYDMIYLQPLTDDDNVQSMMTKLFKKICSAADTVARMTGSDYKYSSIPNTIAQVSYYFEALTNLSTSDDFEQFKQVDEMLGDVDYTNIKLRVTTDAHPKIMAHLQRGRRN